jgi:hypothetical protein
MMSVEQAQFVELVTQTLAAYVKAPTAAEMEAWWITCRPFTFSDVERVLRLHSSDPEDGKRAPRPIDVKRKLAAGTQQGAGCSASGAAGNCAYPGIFSDGTTGGERWWCPWHRVDRAGPEAERWIEVSQSVPYATALAKRAERMLRESQRAPGVVHTAHAIALRHGNRPWQVKGRTRSPVSEPSRRSSTKTPRRRCNPWHVSAACIPSSSPTTIS